MSFVDAQRDDRAAPAGQRRPSRDRRFPAELPFSKTTSRAFTGLGAVPSAVTATGGASLPSWMNTWAKPTVGSATLLPEGMRVREFVARPLPAASARGRYGVSSTGDGSTGLGAADAPSSGIPLRGSGAPPASTGRGMSWTGDGVDPGSGSSVLLHFFRPSSGNNYGGLAPSGPGYSHGSAATSLPYQTQTSHSAPIRGYRPSRGPVPGTKGTIGAVTTSAGGVVASHGLGIGNGGGSSGAGTIGASGLAWGPPSASMTPQLCPSSGVARRSSNCGGIAVGAGAGGAAALAAANRRPLSAGPSRPLQPPSPGPISSLTADQVPVPLASSSATPPPAPATAVAPASVPAPAAKTAPAARHSSHARSSRREGKSPPQASGHRRRHASAKHSRPRGSSGGGAGIAQRASSPIAPRPEGSVAEMAAGDTDTLQPAPPSASSLAPTPDKTAAPTVPTGVGPPARISCQAGAAGALSTCIRAPSFAFAGGAVPPAYAAGTSPPARPLFKVGSTVALSSLPDLAPPRLVPQSPPITPSAASGAGAGGGPARRGPAAPLDLVGLGPEEADVGHMVDATDLVLLVGGTPATVGVASPGAAPVAGAAASVGVWRAGAEASAAGFPAAGVAVASEIGPGDAARGPGGAALGVPEGSSGLPAGVAVAPHHFHVPQAQHMLLSGSLQELCDRLHRSGDRDMHLSLASVTFTGDLDPAVRNTIRIQNRTLILHNCTLALRPGQKLWIGPGANVILADVTMIAIQNAADGPARPTPGSSTVLGRPAAAAPPPQRRRHGHCHGRGAHATPGPSDDHGRYGMPLLHVSCGGRLLLRGCRSRVITSSAATAALARNPSGLSVGGAAQAAAPATAAAAASTGHSPASPGGGFRPQPPTLLSPRASASGADVPRSGHNNGPILSILADSAAAVEAIGCRLGRCVATGAGTVLALVRCRLKPGGAANAPVAAAGTAASGPIAGGIFSAVTTLDAPLVTVADGATLELSHAKVCDGPAAGVAATGAGSRVVLSYTAVLGCHGSGVTVGPGASASISACRVYGNGIAGLAANGHGAVAEASDSEFSGNTGNNVTASSGASVTMTGCAAGGSGGGCGVLAEGTDTRVLATRCSFDGNTSNGARVRQHGILELRDCSASSNLFHGVELDGTIDRDLATARQAAAVLASAPAPAAPLPDICCLIVGGQLAKNGGHGCIIRGGGGLRIQSCELSQNGKDGACVDGTGCELLLEGCSALSNNESGVFVCSGASVWADGCQLGGNLHGDAAVGGHGSRGRLVRCTFDHNAVKTLRVHMGAKVSLRECNMEQRPTADEDGSSPSWRRQRKARKRPGWAVGSVRSQCVQLMGYGSLLSVNGTVFHAEEFEQASSEDKDDETPEGGEEEAAGGAKVGGEVEGEGQGGEGEAGENTEVEGDVKGKGGGSGNDGALLESEKVAVEAAGDGYVQVEE